MGTSWPLGNESLGEDMAKVKPHPQGATRPLVARWFHDAVAARLVAELWETREAVISTQVLQEFHVNATRKIPSPLPRSTARQIVRTYAAWQTEQIGPPEILVASELEEQHQLGLWDSLIVAAAPKGGATRILTGGLSPGPSIAGLRIVGVSFQPGNGSRSIFQPLGAAGSRRARRLVSDLSFATRRPLGDTAALSRSVSSENPGSRRGVEPSMGTK
jgi:predicted nucleic acid-binding protein